MGKLKDMAELFMYVGILLAIFAIPAGIIWGMEATHAVIVVFLAIAIGLAVNKGYDMADAHYNSLKKLFVKEEENLNLAMK